MGWCCCHVNASSSTLRLIYRHICTVIAFILVINHSDNSVGIAVLWPLCCFQNPNRISTLSLFFLQCSSHANDVSSMTIHQLQKQSSFFLIIAAKCYLIQFTSNKGHCYKTALQKYKNIKNILKNKTYNL